MICDKKKLDKRGCNGAPDWIIEIISPSTARHDNCSMLCYQIPSVSVKRIATLMGDTKKIVLGYLRLHYFKQGGRRKSD
ncbi:Uma2 family endonuclease [Lachnospiraceae bacterium ZAX-1]